MGTGPYQKKDRDKISSPERFSREGAKQIPRGKGENDDIPRKGVIRMIVGGPSGGDSHQARKSQVQEAHQISIKEVLDVETMEGVPLIQFGRAKRLGPQTVHNDALVITAILANYEVGRIFIDSGSSAYILFGEAYDQMQLGDVSLKKVNTSLYGRCYVDAIRRGEKRGGDDTQDQAPPNKKGKAPEDKTSEVTEIPTKVQPAEELLNIQISPGDPDKTTRIGSYLSEEAKKEITLCLQRNADVFAWTPQDLQGIDPQVITHHLNIDPNCKPVKQKKRHFGSEKDKIIQAEVNKLMAAGHIEEIQFPEWLSNVVLVPKPGRKWRMCIDFRDLNKACPKDFYPLPWIDQLVDSTSGCELLSMMDASQKIGRKLVS
ncbi:UNVERIFIED_CONTAM: Transposon Ty3-G Gag-Pol polyprotein [Sesamum radiatum]|uniref:Transposon Ty3-G Gag-Pol polyprotein n=1 Tax=Sesamum radiatum TaxID=300843 RepID=A0AAW2QZL6_SESRA